MICASCKTDNPETHQFCGGCGKKLEAVAPVAVPGEDGAFFCAKHTKAITRLRCGRCETPICPRCTVHSPAGTRCRPCSKHRIAVRPAALLHEAGRTLESGVSSGLGRRVWYLVLWEFILSLFLRR